MTNKVPERCIIATMGEGREIGISGIRHAPWGTLPENQKRFYNLTSGSSDGCSVIAGHKTFELIGSLPRCDNIVLTRKSGLRVPPGVEIAHTIEEAVQIARKHNRGRIAIIGGQRVFRQVMNNAPGLELETLYLTIVRGRFPEADEFFPENYLRVFNVFDERADQKIDRSGNSHWLKFVVRRSS